MARGVISRSEMVGATLSLGGAKISLSDYATTGIRAVALAPSGQGKTNAGLVIAEQLAAQGWISVLIDPESELSSLYGEPVASPEDLEARLVERTEPIIVVAARSADEFVPYGRVILDVSDSFRKPIFVLIDEGQLFSTSKRTKNEHAEAVEIIDEFVTRGRKRALDLFITAHQLTSSLSRMVFGSKNLTLVGCQEDPAAWPTLAQQFRGTKIDFGDLTALAPGEFFCISRRGVEKVRLPLAEALQNSALVARPVQRLLPATYKQWSKALAKIPTARLEALNGPVVELLSSVAGLTPAQHSAGVAALHDELEARRE